MDNMKKTGKPQITTLEKKIYVIADEVLNILKHLSHENKQQLNTKLIADQIASTESLTEMLADNEHEGVNSKECYTPLKTIAGAVLDKFTELVPSFMNDRFDNLRGQFNDKSIFEDSSIWLDSSIKIVKKYIDSISSRNLELEEFMSQTMQYLSETEKHMSTELSSHKDKYDSDRKFEDSISSNINTIKDDFNTGGDISKIKETVLGKISNINKGIEKNREQDLQRLQETEKILETMSNRIVDIKSEADELKKRAEEIESESIHDKLTGLHNRKAYDDKVLETLANMDRYDIPSTLLFCDIDHFKKINDTFGHKVGDLTLKKISSLLKGKLRINDFIARYGGEEFAIILPHTSIENASKAAQGILSDISEAVFSYKDQNISLSISIGISSFRKDDDINSILDRADKALYLAKNSGRNAIRTEKDITE